MATTKFPTTTNKCHGCTELGQKPHLTPNILVLDRNTAAHMPQVSEKTFRKEMVGSQLRLSYSKKIKSYSKEMINLKKENKLVSYSGLPIVNVVDPLNSYEKSE